MYHHSIEKSIGAVNSAQILRESCKCISKLYFTLQCKAIFTEDIFLKDRIMYSVLSDPSMFLIVYFLSLFLKPNKPASPLPRSIMVAGSGTDGGPPPSMSRVLEK